MASGDVGRWRLQRAASPSGGGPKVPLLHLEIVNRSDDIKAFVVLPRRWVVERTFSWFGRNRQGLRELSETLATFVTLASIQLALTRFARG